MINFSLFEKNILITGAGGKLAKSFINDFLNKGAKVIGLDIADEPQHINELKKSFKDKFQYYKCDITNKSELKEINNATNSNDFQPNVLINNAAAGQVSFIEGSLVDFTNFPMRSMESKFTS